ncbi:hypothetical protein, partial [Streptococcus suis]|uniref:hypothetical protein n=1 Tax=Streptococcus suis TaxID=1307 RepID=UPI001C93A81A
MFILLEFAIATIRGRKGTPFLVHSILHYKILGQINLACESIFVEFYSFSPVIFGIIPSLTVLQDKNLPNPMHIKGLARFSFYIKNAYFFSILTIVKF